MDFTQNDGTIDCNDRLIKILNVAFFNTKNNNDNEDNSKLYIYEIGQYFVKLYRVSKTFLIAFFYLVIF